MSIIATQIFSDNMRVSAMSKTLQTLRDLEVGCVQNCITKVSNDSVRINNLPYLTTTAALSDGRRKSLRVSDTEEKLQGSSAMWEMYALIQELRKGTVQIVTIFGNSEFILAANDYSSFKEGRADDMLILFNKENKQFITWGRADQDRLITPLALDVTDVLTSVIDALKAAVQVRGMPALDKSSYSIRQLIQAILRGAYTSGFIGKDLSDKVFLSGSIEISAFRSTLDSLYIYGKGAVSVSDFITELKTIDTTNKSSNNTNETPKQAQMAEATTKGNSIMNLTKIITANKDAAVNAGKMEAGRLVVDRIIAVLKKQKAVPLMLRAYLDSDVGRVLVANVFKAAVDAYAPDNRIAKLASEKAVDSAVLQLVQGFDIPALVASVMDGITMSPDSEVEPSNQVPVFL